MVTGASEGMALISATSEGRTGTATVTVAPEPVARVTVEPAQSSLDIGDTAQLSAHVVGTSGAALPRLVNWESSDPGVASVSQSGVVRAAAPGSATITARVGDRSGQAAITVRTTAEPQPPEPTAEEMAAQIDARLEAYRQALESEDIAAVRRTYPGLTAGQESSWRNFFEIAEQVRVTFTILDHTIGDGVATARVSMHLTYRADGPEDRTSEVTATLERIGQGWRLIRIQ